MIPQHVPVVLVHGWRSHPGIWNRLIPRLSHEGIPFGNFDHTTMEGMSVAEIATALQDYICMKREETGYQGQIDIVCHSMGGGIARYLLEVLDGTARHEQVRQLIAIGPPNNGSAMAELFNHPVHGPKIIARLTNVFVPEGYNPADDIIVQEFRPGSTTMRSLAAAGTRRDIRYQLILAANPSAAPGFFPCFEGRTWESDGNGSWHQTCAGDGIVPHSESVIPGAAVEIVPADPAVLSSCGDQYCHIKLPRSPEVVDRVMDFLFNFSNCSSQM
ncbi:MAG: alpha/beta fold hydrolase [Methanoregula sp.]